jgi:hypothetical protein
MSGIGVVYQDKYAVEETFQLLKIPWEWYDSSEEYDVVIGRGEDLKSEDVNFNLIDLSEDDVFKKVSNLLNQGVMHNREPLCEMYLDELRRKLKQFTILVEIPPVPWGYSYMVALTHDVDITSVKERSWFSVGYAIYNCFLNRDFIDGVRILVAKTKTFKKSFIKKLFTKDPWNCFEEWLRIEDEMGVKSSFYFIPFKNLAGIDAPKIREAKYDLDEGLIRKLVEGGWEVGVHGIDNWKDVKRGKEELSRILKLINPKIGTRIHWLFFDEETWKRLDEAGYYYDTSFGYNDDVGFRAGTLQVYPPRGVKNLVELPLHIQDGSLFRRKYLNLPEDEAKKRCDEIFDYVKKYGGVVTLLWHQVSLASPHDWGDFYRYLVEKGSKEGAWVTRAVDVVDWFKMRRSVKLSYMREGNKLKIRLKGLENREGIPKMRLRIHVEPERIKGINGEYVAGEGYVDVMCDRERIEVVLE